MQNYFQIPPAPSGGGTAIGSAATIRAFTQSATLRAAENITSNKTGQNFIQAATLTIAGAKTISSSKTIGPFSQSATLKTIEHLQSAKTIPPFTQNATLTKSSPATITSAKTIAPFVQVAILNAVENITSSVTFGNFTITTVTPSTIAAGKIRKKHSKRYEVTINGITFMAQSVPALEAKVAAWRLAHPANDKEPDSPKPQKVDKAAAIAVEAKEPPREVIRAVQIIPPPVTISAAPILPRPTLAEGLALIQGATLLGGIDAEAQQKAFAQAVAIEEARLRAQEEDDIAALRIILEAVA